jgi:hypothetical protein
MEQLLVSQICVMWTLARQRVDASFYAETRR